MINKSYLINISSTKRLLCFIYLLFIKLSTHIEQGVLVSNILGLKAYFSISTIEVGTFGSILFIGNTVGCLILFILINKFNRKYLLITSIITTVITLYILTKLQSNFISFIIRFILGITNSFIDVYIPIYIEQCSINKYKSFMMAIHHSFEPLGYLCGYILNIYTSWDEAFLIQNILMLLILIIIVLYTDDDLFNVNKTTSNIHSLYNQCLHCIQTPLFSLVTLSLTFAYFIISGIQIWLSDYLENTIQLTETYTRVYIFLLIYIPSSICGILFGGVIINYICKGYHTKHAIVPPLISSILSAFIAYFVIRVNDVYTFSICMWLYLFCNAFVIPGLNGIVLSSVSKENVAAASVLNVAVINAFGKFSAPNVYGYLKDKYYNVNNKCAMWWLVNAIHGSILLLGVSTWVNYSSYFYKENNEDNKIQGVNKEEQLQQIELVNRNIHIEREVDINKQ